MHYKLLHEALQEEEIRAVLIEVKHDASEDKEKNYAVDYEDDYKQGDSEEDQEDDQKKGGAVPNQFRRRHTPPLSVNGDAGGGW